MPIKLGTKELKLPGIEKAFLGSTLVYVAYQILHAIGTVPLVLSNAISHALQSLTQIGKCTQPSGVWNTAITQEGKVEQRNLPQGYTELEYIGSDSTAYIDTGVAGASDLECSATFSYGTYQMYGRIWSNYAGDDYNSCRFILGGTSNSAICNCNTRSFTDGNIEVSKGVTANDIHTATVYPGGTRAVVDGNEYTKKSPATGLENTNTIWLLTQPSGTEKNIGAKIYLFTVKKGGILIRDMRPAKRNSDNAIGMYDLVTQMFFEKQGTGTFTAGSAVTPSPERPVDIVTNNGALKYGKPLTLDPTRYYAYIGSGNYWSYSSDSYSIVIPVTVGKKYRITADPTTPVEGNILNVILRWGFVDTVYDNWKQPAVTPPQSVILIYDWVRSTPQDTQSVEVTATHPYMVLQMGAASFASNIANGRVGVAVQEVYVDGTPEVLTISGINLLDPSTSNITIGEYINEQGQAVVVPNNWRTTYIPVISGKTYIFYGRRKADNAISAYCRINFYTADKTAITPRPSYTRDTPTVATAPSNAAYVQLSCAPFNSQNPVTRDIFDQFNWMFAEAAQEIPFEPYVAPQTVTDIPMLLGVGDYKDEAELINGIKTGKVGILRLSPDWTWLKSNTYTGSFYTNDVTAANKKGNDPTTLCTHGFMVNNLTEYSAAGAGAIYWYSAYTINYKFDDGTATAGQFKQFLTDNVVLVLFPLDTEQTEQGTVYPKLVNAKYNTASVTAAVSDIQVEFTTGEQTAPNQYSPLPIVCNNGELKWNGTTVVTDGTSEVLTVSGAQMLDPSTVPDENRFIASTDGSTQAPSAIGGVFRHSEYIPVKDGTKYFFGMTPYVASLAGIAWYSTAEPTSFISGVNGSTLKNSYSMKYTAPEGAKYLRFSWCIDKGYDADWERSVYLCECDSNGDPIMATWQAYTAPQTASVPMLLSVGDAVRDEAELIHGLITHKVGIKVFDGTENWRASSSANIYILDSAIAVDLTAICTHFQKVSNATSASNMPDGSFKGHSSNAILYFKDVSAGDVDGFKARIAAQYAAGTPVIMLYALATETTEQGEAHALHTSEGTNVVDAMTSVGSVNLEVDYAGKT